MLFLGLGRRFLENFSILDTKVLTICSSHLLALHLFQLATLVVRMVLTDRTIKSSNRRPHMSPAQAPHAWRLPSHYRPFYRAAVCAEMLCASLDPCRGSPCRCARDRCARALKPQPGAAQRDCTPNSAPVAAPGTGGLRAPGAGMCPESGTVPASVRRHFVGSCGSMLCCR